MNQNTYQSKPFLTFIHFNDVYDIQPSKNGTAGAVNFQAYLRKIKSLYPDAIIVFSGDAFSPSTLTNIFDGLQMVTALNKFKIDVACIGNHQFDLERDQTKQLLAMCNFPWLQGNIILKDTKMRLGNGLTHVVKEVNGKRIGFFGVAGEDWLGILGDEYEDELQYEDVNEFSIKISKMLRQEEKCDVVIGLTHMRVVQDKQMPEKCDGVDLVLGGHDHIIMQEFINEIPVIKSGCNFKNLSLIKVYSKSENHKAKYKGRRFDFDIQKHIVPIAENQIDKQLKQYVEKCLQEYEKYDRLIGYTDVYLDTRFSRVRTMETNYGNFVADLVRNYYDCDCCVLNSGFIRNDIRIKPGKINFSMISNLINDVLVVKQVTGKLILSALQYSVSSLPECFSGSFLVISGIRYTFDYRKNPKVQQVTIQNKPLNLEHTYSVAMKSYISNGGDGFTMFKDCPYIIDFAKGIETLTLLLKFFKASETDCDIQKLGVMMKQNKMTPAKLEQLQEEQKVVEDDEIFDIPSQLLILRKKVSTKIDRISKLRRKLILGPEGKKYVCIGPKLDGRIRSLAEEEKINQTQILPF